MDKIIGYGMVALAALTLVLVIVPERLFVG
jgi:hypothetical protein